MKKNTPAELARVHAERKRKLAEAAAKFNQKRAATPEISDRLGEKA